MVRKRMASMREKLDPHETGGAPLLGVNGVAIIAHGSSNARAIRNALRAAANEALVNHVNVEIAEILGRSQPAAAAKPAGKGIRALFSRMRERLHRHPREAEGSAKTQEIQIEPPIANHVATRPLEREWTAEEAPRADQEKARTGDLKVVTNGATPHEEEKPHDAEPPEAESKTTKHEPT
jgi:hypothetical protein